MVKTKKKSGGKRIKDDGKSLVWAVFNGADKAIIRTAAGISGKPMSQIVSETALEACKKIVADFRRK